ncbi:MAG: WG repeat-containing protein [Bacteroidota bacterium]
MKSYLVDLQLKALLRSIPANRLDSLLIIHYSLLSTFTSMLRFIVVVFVCLLGFNTSTSAENQFPTPSKASSGLYGYADASGKYVIEPQYEKAMPFSNGVARVKKSVGWSVINEKGKVITKKPYEEIGDYKNGVSVVSIRGYTDGKYNLFYGIISSKGSEIIEPIYNYITYDSANSLFIVGKATEPDENQASSKKATVAVANALQARFGVLTAEGKIVIPLQYEAVRDYQFKLFAAKSTDGHWKVFNVQGQEIFKGDYTDIRDFDEEYATVKKDYRWGILNKTGKIIKPLVYRDIVRTGKFTYNLLPMPQWKVVDQQNNQKFSYEFEDVRAVNEVLYSYQLEGKRGLMTEKGEIITPPVYERIAPITGDLTVVQMNRKYGVIDKTGQTILSNDYDNILIDSLTALIQTKNGAKIGVYNKLGKQIIPIRHDAVRVQPDGTLVINLGGKWGTTDTKGSSIIPIQYQFIGDFSFGKARAKLQEGMGVIDTKGNWLVEPLFEDTHIINDSLCVYFTNGRSGIINTHQKAMRLAVDSLGVMDNGYILVKNLGKYGLYNQQAKEIIPIQYDFLSTFGADSMITVRVGDKEGLINIRGKMILRPSSQFQELQVMHEERSGVRINNKYGFIDKEGRLRIANRYEGITPFSEGMAGIQIKGKWGFIDKAEALRVQPYYEEVRLFKHGVAMVRRGKFWGFVDKNGREVLKPQYDTLAILPNRRCLITKNGKTGLINEQGKELFIPKYDYLSDLGNGFVILGIKNKFGLYSLGNYDVVPISYDAIAYNPWNKLYTLAIKYPWQPFSVSR